MAKAVTSLPDRGTLVLADSCRIASPPTAMARVTKLMAKPRRQVRDQPVRVSSSMMLRTRPTQTNKVQATRVVMGVMARTLLPMVGDVVVEVMVGVPSWEQQLNLAPIATLAGSFLG